jgi:hypothetical protein
MQGHLEFLFIMTVSADERPLSTSLRLVDEDPTGGLRSGHLARKWPLASPGMDAGMRLARGYSVA